MLHDNRKDFSVSVHAFRKFYFYFKLRLILEKYMAEEVGIEPTHVLPPIGFQDRPLNRLSIPPNMVAESGIKPALFGYEPNQKNHS